MKNSELITRREALLGFATLFYRSPVQIVRGEGVYLYDESGKQYIDMYNNVPCVGHANPTAVSAMQEQMGTLNVHSRYLHEAILDFAERLLGLHSAALDSIVFTCSGTEASEVALLMARHATNCQGIICTDATYHGNSSEVRKMFARPQRSMILRLTISPLPTCLSARFWQTKAYPIFLQDLCLVPRILCTGLAVL